LIKRLPNDPIDDTKKPNPRTQRRTERQLDRLPADRRPQRQHIEGIPPCSCYFHSHEPSRVAELPSIYQQVRSKFGWFKRGSRFEASESHPALGMQSGEAYDIDFFYIHPLFFASIFAFFSKKRLRFWARLFGSLSSLRAWLAFLRATILGTMNHPLLSFSRNLPL